MVSRAAVLRIAARFALLCLLCLLVSGRIAVAAEPGSFVPDVEVKQGEIPSTPTPVRLQKNAADAWRFYVEDREFPIRGAGGASTPGLLEHLKAAGGNCIRTWGIETLEDKLDGERLIDRAYRLGIMVIPGIWVQHERHGFDYGNPNKVREQRERVLANVRKYKNHPAVLCWGLGNEMEGPSSASGSLPVYKEVEELAKLVKAEDPHHPIMTVIAFNPQKIPHVQKLCPSIDILGLNAYGSAGGAGEALKKAGWDKPFLIAEFGVRGFWEVQATPWGAPYEPTSQEKARTYYATHRSVCDINPGKDLCLGTFAFLWGWKQEKTATWFGMFLPTLEKLPQVDAMTKAWTGEWPGNRCPKISGLSSLAYGKVVRPKQTISAQVDVEDPDGDPLQYEWVVVAESTARSEGGDAEAAPPSFPGLVQKSEAECVFVTPQKRGDYRLFLTVRDGKGGAATANFPFRVE